MMKQKHGCEFFGQTDYAGLWANIIASVVTVLGVNAFLFVVNRSRFDDLPPSRFDLPGWLVGSVWIALFAVLGVARWIVLRTGTEHSRSNARIIVLLMLFCLAYPFYTLGLRSLVMGIIGNFLTIGAAGWAAWKIRLTSQIAALLVLSVAAWVSFANVLIFLSVFSR